jgi:uncharacterized protein YukE
VGPLTPYDVKRWDLDAIQKVFETANGRANTLQRLGENLRQVHNVLSGWEGEAGEAFRADLGKARSDIDADGQESRQVAAAVSVAEADVRACKRELDDIERAADANGWTITPDWRIDVGNTGIGRDPKGFAAQRQLLQDRLNALKAHVHSADHELATAIRSAVGEVPLAAIGNPPGGTQPRSLQDMLLPAGAADPGPGNGPPSGAPNPADGAGAKPPSLQDLLLPTGKQPTSGEGDQPQPGSLPDLLSRLQQPVVPGAPAPQLKPAEVESFKAMARQSMIRDGVPPDQIEARLNDIVGRTQQWIDNGIPNYVPPEPPRPPPPGFGEGFGDRWFATEQGIKNLIGQGGPGAPGVLQSWQQMLKGTVETVQNPFGAAAGEIKIAFDSPSPAYYLGAKASDAATTLPGLMFGGEGAAALRAGEVADLDAAAGLPHDFPGGHPPISQIEHALPGATDLAPTHIHLPDQPSTPIGLEHPVTYDAQATQAGLDANTALLQGQPTADVTHPFADMSTHYIGDNPDRVVLGKYDGQDGGYIGEARAHGGIYYDTGPQAWDALTHRLSEAQAQDLAWEANEAFLRKQMENHVSRIEYILPEGYDSIDQVARIRRESFSALEINFLDQNGAKFGYRRSGNAWVYEGG